MFICPIQVSPPTFLSGTESLNNALYLYATSSSSSSSSIADYNCCARARFTSMFLLFCCFCCCCNCCVCITFSLHQQKFEPKVNTIYLSLNINNNHNGLCTRTSFISYMVLPLPCNYMKFVYFAWSLWSGYDIRNSRKIKIKM